MNLVTIDTSTRFAGVGVQNQDGERAIRSWRSNQNHGRELMPALVESLRRVNLTPAEISHVSVALGPGGFSAVRVGISAALGLTVTSQLPVLGIPTHVIELEPWSSLLQNNNDVYTLLPAGRNEISWTRHSNIKKSTSGVSSPEELASTLEENSVLCGEASELMVGHVNGENLRLTELPTRDPNSLLDISIRKFGNGEVTAYKSLRPIYARPPSISKPNPRK